MCHLMCRYVDGEGRWFELKREEDERLRGVCGRGWYMLDW